jgi:hypothetical protein
MTGRGRILGSGARPPACGAHGGVAAGCVCELCRGQRTFNNARLREHRRANPTYVKRMNLKQFGLTYEQWAEMRDAQGGRCKVCQQLKQLCVDHDHKTGAVRGLLCHSCNRALGLLGDSPERLNSLLQYRRAFPC